MFKPKKIIADITLPIEKMVFGGQAMGHVDGRAAFVWNALPGESVRANVIKKRRGVYEAIARDILKPSNERIAPLENHYLSCSPWQIMTWEAENEYKAQTAYETYRQFGGFDPKELPIEFGEVTTAYRNKMEYSFIETPDGVSLAFFMRGTRRLQPIYNCVLGSQAMNKAAIEIVDWLNDVEYSCDKLKTLILRSTNSGEVIAGLFIKDESAPTGAEILVKNKSLNGIQIIYSRPNSPASVVTKVLESHGIEEVEETVAGSKLRYGLNSFFQINIEVFEMALNRIKEFLPKNKPLVDLYCGVGSISIPLKDLVSSAKLVELNEEATHFAEINCKNNNCKNFEVRSVAAEDALEMISADATLIVDPPRVGLHTKVTERILEVKPETVIYLSCNVATQARDLKLLQAGYDIIDLRLYNFFPRTPHVEALAILKKKQK